MWEYSTKPKYVKILMNNQNIMFGLSPPPMGKIEKSKNVRQYVLMNIKYIYIYIYPFLLREYYLFSHNTESSLEQKYTSMHFCKKSIIK